MAAALASVGLIHFQMFRVRLHDVALFQEQQAQFVARHPCHKSLRLVESGP